MPLYGRRNIDVRISRRRLGRYSSLYCAARRRPVPGPILHEEEGSEKYILVLTPNHSGNWTQCYTLTSEGMVRSSIWWKIRLGVYIMSRLYLLIRVYWIYTVCIISWEDLLCVSILSFSSDIIYCYSSVVIVVSQTWRRLVLTASFSCIISFLHIRCVCPPFSPFSIFILSFLLWFQFPALLSMSRINSTRKE